MSTNAKIPTEEATAAVLLLVEVVDSTDSVNKSTSKLISVGEKLGRGLEEGSRLVGEMSTVGRTVTDGDTLGAAMSTTPFPPLAVESSIVGATVDGAPDGSRVEGVAVGSTGLDVGSRVIGARLGTKVEGTALGCAVVGACDFVGKCVG